jgi:AraC family transcriptional regulator
MGTASVARNPAFLNGRTSRLHRLIAISSSPRPADPVKLAPTTLAYQGARSVTTFRKSWTGISAQLAEIRCDGPLEVDLTADQTRLSVVLEEVGGRLEVRARCLPARSGAHEAARPLSLIPAGLDAVGQAAHARLIRHLVLDLEESKLARIFGDEIDLARAFEPRLMFSDPGIMHLAQLFADECARDEPHSLLYGDSLSLVLLLGLSGLSPSAPESARQGALAPWQLRRVTEYLAEHLADDVQLQTVSDLVNLSRSYFSRAFKSSTGLAPHQWLLQARIAKAKQLLLDTQLPLAQIAVEIGFADQAHFTRTFRRAVGQSPGAWQRARSA